MDTSAPATGVVKDSLPGQADLDFQQSFTIHASWDGFFDKESGVLFYQYALADECLDDVEFSLPTPNALVSLHFIICHMTVLITKNNIYLFYI